MGVCVFGVPLLQTYRIETLISARGRDTWDTISSAPKYEKIEKRVCERTRKEDNSNE